MKNRTNQPLAEIASRGYAHPEFLVTTDWVAGNLTGPGLRIVESNEDSLLYASGHIPGAVENPQGVSARATAVILDKVLSGVPLDDVVRVPSDVIYQIFGLELSMGKNLGLTNMLIMCQAAARQTLKSGDKA